MQFAALNIHFAAVAITALLMGCEEENQLACNHEDKLETLVESSEQGDLVAQFCLGVAYMNGTNEAKQDFPEAARLFEVASSQGNYQASFNLSLMHFRGQGVSWDIRESIKWQEVAAKQGSKIAKENLEAMKPPKNAQYLVAFYIPGESGISTFYAAEERLSSQTPHLINASTGEVFFIPYFTPGLRIEIIDINTNKIYRTFEGQ